MSFVKREIDIEDVKESFSLISGVLHRKTASKDWYPMRIKLDKRGYCTIRFKKSHVGHTRILFMLANDRNILENMDIDHIDRNPWNNDPSNLQELSHRDNLSKEKTYNPKANKYNAVVFSLVDLDNKPVPFHIGTFHDDDLREHVWHTIAPLFLFRQELKGNQQARERLIEMVELGDIVAAKTLVKAYALAHGVTMK